MDQADFHLRLHTVVPVYPQHGVRPAWSHSRCLSTTDLRPGWHRLPRSFLSSFAEHDPTPSEPRAISIHPPLQCSECCGIKGATFSNYRQIHILGHHQPEKSWVRPEPWCSCLPMDPPRTVFSTHSEKYIYSIQYTHKGTGTHIHRFETKVSQNLSLLHMIDIPIIFVYSILPFYFIFKYWWSISDLRPIIWKTLI